MRPYILNVLMAVVCAAFVAGASAVPQKNATALISIEAESWDDYKHFLSKHNFTQYRHIMVKPVICSIEKGKAQTVYTHVCNSTHDNLGQKTELFFNNINQPANYYFKGDSDIVIDLDMLTDMMNYYFNFNKPLYFTKFIANDLAGFVGLGFFYGVNFQRNFTQRTISEDFDFANTLKPEVNVVDLSTYYCGGYMPACTERYCKYLVIHRDERKDKNYHCNLYHSFTPYESLKTIEYFRNQTVCLDWSSQEVIYNLQIPIGKDELTTNC
ncbi:hypothetical protein Unana1_05635 [Umbelopsis nana]